MNDHTHIIGKQVLDLTIEDMNHAFDFQHEVSHIMRTRVAPAMEKLFDHLVEGDQVVRVDSIEVDLGRIRPDRIGEDLVGLVIDALNDQLVDKLSFSTKSEKSLGSVPVTITKQERLLEAWLYFLGHGRLPWWQPDMAPTIFEQFIVPALRNHPAWKDTISTTLQKQRARERFILQYPDSLIAQLMGFYMADPSVLFERLKEIYQVIVSNDTDVRWSKGTPRFAVWELLIRNRLEIARTPLSDAGKTNFARTVLSAMMLEKPSDVNEELILVRQIIHSKRHLSSSWQKYFVEAFDCLIDDLKFRHVDESTWQDGKVDEDATSMSESVSNLDERSEADIAEIDRHGQDIDVQTLEQEQGPQGQDTDEAEMQHWKSRDENKGDVEQPVETMQPLEEENETEPGIIDASEGKRHGNNESERSVNRASTLHTSSEHDRSSEKKDDALRYKQEKEIDSEGNFRDSKKERVGPASSKEKQDVQNNEADRSREAHRKLAPVLQEGEAIYVSHTGLVLLHPYLNAHFETLGWVVDGAFKDDRASQYAIHQLCYLATGEQTIPEYEMTIHKVLCGYPIEESVDRFVKISQTDRNEAENLVNAVIRNWPALKSTTSDGLREGFLQRDGKLIQKNGYWLLKVENRTIDILLARLPWGYGTIKLPWMDERLVVEWV